MKNIINILKRTRLTAASVFVLLAVSVLAGTVYAVTIDAVSEEVGDGASRVFSWTIDTSQDSRFKPVTKITGNFGSSTASTQTVTNLVYTLKSPGDETEYAKFRIFQDEIIPVGSTTQETLEHYV